MAKPTYEISDWDASKEHILRITFREIDDSGKILETYVVSVPPSHNKYQILEELKKQVSPRRKQKKKIKEMIATITPEEIEQAITG